MTIVSFDAPLPVDLSALGIWPQKIGEFAIAFGALEAETVRYLRLLETFGEQVESVLFQSFNARVDYIVIAIHRHYLLAADDAELFAQTWAQAQQLADWRDRLTHFRLEFKWSEEADRAGPPNRLQAVEDVTGNNVDATVELDLVNLEELIARAGTLAFKLYRWDEEFVKSK
ncbi:MAG: hypothetical protein JWM78_847 [Verrucomicrobiaceae bacterium]|nr:hypothetical protein [Verrucomicrobiaceae bacterium]